MNPKLSRLLTVAIMGCLCVYACVCVCMLTQSNAHWEVGDVEGKDLEQNQGAVCPINDFLCGPLVMF